MTSTATEDAATDDDIAAYRQRREMPDRFQPTNAGHPILLEISWAYSVVAWASRDGGPSKWRTSLAHDGPGSGAERPTDDDVARARTIVKMCEHKRADHAHVILKFVALGGNIATVASRMRIDGKVAERALASVLDRLRFEYSWREQHGLLTP